jgi:hypothetical protein
MEEVNFDPNDAGTTTLFAGMEFELSTSADKYVHSIECRKFLYFGADYTTGCLQL